MDKQIITDNILAKHVDEPQKSALASAALAAIYSGIKQLESLGHRYALVLEELVIEEFPKVLYHDSRPSVVVNSADEQADLDPGYRETPGLPSTDAADSTATPTAETES